ncbi:MAG: 3-dehydroquinate synthase [Treponema sp.]|nr:3-dehydroquinate synthase [Treponema sp.]
MKTITVKASKTYDILIDGISSDGVAHECVSLLDKAGSVIRKTSGGYTAAIVTDDILASLYEKRLKDSLEKNGYRVVSFVFPHGESSKNTDTFLSLISFLAQEKLSRSDIVIALGGGVTGDITGFAASSYLRGCRFVQIPTTLLAAVDSSVGGKTAVNIPAGKNLLGSFYQPDVVLCDTSLLSTLPADVFKDGCAEVIKYGIIADYKIADRSLFESLAQTPINTQLEEVIAKCVEIKRDIVMKDEFDNADRKLLNFGHTVGHAIESLSEYGISHGQAVAIGMVIESRAAVRLGLCKEQCLQDILEMLTLYGLPVSTTFKVDEITSICLSDKKRDGKSLTMIFPVEIGKCVLKEIPVDELENVIRLGLEEI